MLAAVLVHAAHAALEDAEEAFHGVRMGDDVIVPDVLILAVIDDAVGGEVPAN